MKNRNSTSQPRSHERLTPLTDSVLSRQAGHVALEAIDNERKSWEQTRDILFSLDRKTTWNKEGIDIEAAMNATTGPFLEVGGPTVKLPRDYPYDQSKITKPMLVSNLVPEPIKAEVITSGLWPFRRQEISFNPHESEYIDLQADAQKMPIADESVGALFASALPLDVRGRFTHEAQRVVEPNGFMVIQSADIIDAWQAYDYGFDLVRAAMQSEERPGYTPAVYHLLLQKSYPGLESIKPAE